MRAKIILLFFMFWQQACFAQQDSSKQFIPNYSDVGNYIPDIINSLIIEATIFSNGNESEVKRINIGGNENGKHEVLESLIEMLSKRKLYFIDMNHYIEYRIIVNDKYIMAFVDRPIVQIDTLMK